MDKSKFKTIYNKSFTYILPILGELLKIELSDVSACYIGDGKRPEFDAKILLIFQSKFLLKNRGEAIGHELFVDTYIGAGNKEVFVFKVPESDTKNLVKFIDGKYSEFDDAHKKRILAFHQLDNDSRVNQVLTKHLALKKQLEDALKVVIPENQELSSKPDMLNESYSLLHFTHTQNYFKKGSSRCITVKKKEALFSKSLAVNPDGKLIHLVSKREVVGLRARHQRLKGFDFKRIIFFKTKPLP